MLFHKSKENIELDKEAKKIKAEKKRKRKTKTGIFHPINDTKHAHKKVKHSIAYYQKQGKIRARQRLNGQPESYYRDRDAFSQGIKSLSGLQKIGLGIALIAVVSFIAIGLLS